MGINKITKLNIVKEFQRNDKDFGSSEVQIAILSKNILILTAHLKKFKKDLHSKRGLINIVNKRRKLLDYIKNTNNNLYLKTIKKLNIRK